MAYNVSDGSKPMNMNITYLVAQIWNDPVTAKLIDQQAGKFYLMDSAS